MLPPVSPSTLANNPLFNALYANLTSKILNPEDATTQAHARSHDALDHELRLHRAELAKTELLQRELELLSSNPTSLPEEIQELLDLTTTAFFSNLSHAEKELLADDIDELQHALPLIGAAVSKSLEKSALILAQLIHPTEKSRQTLLSNLDHLPGDIAHRRKSLLHIRGTLAAHHTSLTLLASSYLDLHNALTSLTHHHLSTKTTLVSPALVAKSTHLSMVASSMLGKLRVMKFEALKHIYDEDATDALVNYKMHLADTNARLVARQRTVEEGLRKYEKAGTDMKGIVERYGAVLRSAEAVRRDIAKLGGVA